MNTLNRFMLSALVLYALFHANATAQNTSFCDELLPISLLQEICGAAATDVNVKITATANEDLSHCNRLYGKGTPNLFKNNLQLLVSPLNGGKSARDVIQDYAKSAEWYASFEYLAQLGDYGVRYLEPDQGSGSTCGVVAFVKDNMLIELKDTNWGDRDLNPFIFNVEQLQIIAEKIAERMEQ